MLLEHYRTDSLTAPGLLAWAAMPTQLLDLKASSTGEVPLLSRRAAAQCGQFAALPSVRPSRLSPPCRYQLLNSVLPVVLCALLGFIIFFLEMSELASRLEIIATLFLALTAVQFVLVDNTPASSYVSHD